VKAQLEILGGDASTRAQVFSQQEITIGRHPQCDVQFHPQRDLDVSARHAMVYRTGPHWSVRDLSSRNGTLVNGHPIQSPTRLSDTDHITLGSNGPTLEFRLVPDHVSNTQTPQPILAAPRATGAAETVTPDRPARHTEGTVTQRVRIRVAHETRRLRTVIIGLAVLLAVALTATVYLSTARGRERDRAVVALKRKIDSVLAAHSLTVQGLKGEVQGLTDAFERSQRDLRSLQDQLSQANASGDTERIASLRRQLGVAITTIAQQQSAAQIDYVRVREDNQRAVALVWVETREGTVVSGSGFAVQPQGLVVTSRHVVLGESGTDRPARIAVQFADSDQAFAADLVSSPSLEGGPDIALLQVRIRGSVPVVKGINTRPDTLAVGSPVAMLGFPHGTDLPMRPGRANVVASATLTAGIISRMLPNRLQILGYGAEGASGSPVFDARGEVVGVLFGGEEASDHRIVYGVPSNLVRDLIDGR